MTTQEFSVGNPNEWLCRPDCGDTWYIAISGDYVTALATADDADCKLSISYKVGNDIATLAILTTSPAPRCQPIKEVRLTRAALATINAILDD